MARYRIRKTPRERFWSYVDRSGGNDPDTCWPWRGSLSADGQYGRFSLPDGSRRRSTRIAWEWQVGPIPDGYQLDHLCRNPLCVRVSHLEAVPVAVNMARRSRPTTGRRQAAIWDDAP